MATELPTFAAHPPFVGREDIIEKCNDFISAEGGKRYDVPFVPKENMTAASLCLRGPPGCGKTRIMLEVSKRMTNALLIISECTDFAEQGLFSSFEAPLRVLLGIHDAKDAQDEEAKLNCCFEKPWIYAR